MENQTRAKQQPEGDQLLFVDWIRPRSLDSCGRRKQRTHEDPVTLVPVEVEVACRCSKWPFPHIHSDEDREKDRRMWRTRLSSDVFVRQLVDK